MKNAIIDKPSKALNEACLEKTGYPAPIVARWNSFHAFLDDASKIPVEYQREWTAIDPETLAFQGNCKDWQQAVSMARRGNEEMGTKARGMMDQLSEQGLFSYGPSQLGLEVVGFAPCVPAYLTGHPESMFQMAEGKGLATPIRVFAGIGAGGWVSADTMLQRGVALTALVLALSTLRPVELYAFTNACNDTTKRPTICIWPVETRPVDLTSVAHQLSHASMHRVFAFGMADALWQRPAGGRPIPNDGRRDGIEQVARLALQAEPQDVVIPRATHGADDPLVTRPLEWLREVIATHVEEYMPQM